MPDIPAPAVAYTYRAKALTIHDGDTFTADVDLGFGTHTWVRLRLHGVNCPELSAQDGSGQRAKDFTVHLLEPQGTPAPLVIRSFRDRMSFERWVADVWMEGDDRSIADRIIEAGYGVVFMP